MNRYKPYFWVLGIIVLLVVTFSIYQSIIYKTEVSEFDLKASISDVAGVSTDSHFVLKTTAPLSTQVLEKYIKILPEVKFSVNKMPVEENTYEIVPDDSLVANKIYTIQIDKGPLAKHDFSWAYQTKAPFQLIASIPGNKGTSVSINSGIELQFNRENIVSPDKYIEFSPAISGKFVVSGSKVTFVPSRNLTERVVYTVKIKKGLGAEGTSDVLADDKVIQFKTSYAYRQDEPYAYFTRQFNEFKPGTEAVFGVSANNLNTASVSVYNLNSAEGMVDSVAEVIGSSSWASFQSLRGNFLEKNKVLDAKVVIEQKDYNFSIRLSQVLPQGFYAIVIKTDKTEDVAWFQVSPTLSFAAFSNAQSLIWLKDVSGERNIPNAKIYYNGKQISETGTNGVALFDTPTELIAKSESDQYQSTPDRKFFVVKISSGDVAIPYEDGYGYSSRLSQKDSWWKYISLNKNVYLSTDTLHFWAIEKPREGLSSGEEMEAVLTNSYWGEMTDDLVTYASTKIKVSDYSTLTGDISFSNLKPGLYYLSIKRGNEVVDRQVVTVDSYIKPAYTITAEPTKNAIFAGEELTFKVKAKFFDGTPVANTKLTYNGYGPADNYNDQITLDKNGEATISLTPNYSETNMYWPSYLSITIKPTNAEEGQIETNASVFVFGPHVNNQISQKQNVSNVDFEVKTRTVSLERSADSVVPYWNSEDYLGNAVPGAITNIKVVKIDYIADQSGTGYDEINKVTYPIYSYRTQETEISKENVSADQNGIAKYSYIPNKDQTYKIIFSTSDGVGRIVTNERYVYLSSGSVDNYNYPDTYYDLYNVDQKSTYKVGESYNFQLQTYQNSVPTEGKDKYIFLMIYNGSIEYKIQDTPVFSGIFKAENIPNIGIMTGYFSQNRFHGSRQANVSFDVNERRLKIDISKDKDIYKPGEKVSLNIKVTDASGRPTKAEVNLSVLDEAVFAVRRDEVDVVDTLYRDIYSQVFIRTSNMPPMNGGGAEKGGGGDGVRTNIKEMALFKSVVTDGNGFARVEFKLPDNITSWRLTSQAITKDLFAGKNVSFVPVTLPLFVDATLNNTYLSGDKLVLRLRTFGTNLTNNPISYSVEGSTLSFKKIEKSGGESVDIPLGSLTVGNHEIKVKSTSGGLSDALVRNINVLDSYFSKKTTDYFDVVSGLKILNKATGYTTLNFSLAEQGKAYETLKTLSYQDGQRLDQKGARQVAVKLLNSAFNEKNEDVVSDFRNYQTLSEGVQLLPYSSDDLRLSALSTHVLDNSSLDMVSLERYFTSSLSDSKTDTSRVVLALYGLSAFDEPILTKVQVIKKDKNLSLIDKVFVALTLDSLGAKEEARGYYKDVIKPKVKVSASYASLDGLSDDENITTTTLLAALATSLDEPEAKKYALFVEQNVPKATLNNFEKIIYVKSVLSKQNPSDASFSYKLGTRGETKKLKAGESFRLTLSPQELASLEISNVKGQLGVVTTYDENASPNSIVKDQNLALARDYQVDGRSVRTFSEGDLVKVILKPEFKEASLDGSYQIVDYLPSGLRPIEDGGQRYYSSYGNRIYPVEIDNQKVTFVISKDNVLPIYYSARVVSKGIYKSEPATIQSLTSLESITISKEDSVTVK